MLKLILSILLLAAGVQAPAIAQEVQPDVHVYHRDLDLRTTEGIRTFDHRIADAIDAACGRDSSAELARKIEKLHCQKAKRAEVAGQRSAVLARDSSSKTNVASSR